MCKKEQAARAASIVTTLVGALLLAWALSRLVPDASSALRYAALPSRSAPRGATADKPGATTVDWGSLPPSCAAWARVEGTSVDLPVAMASEKDPEYYLDHDLWGSPTDMGCPFVDARCGSADSPLVVCYGHRTYLPATMFGDLSMCWDQAEFDRVGTLWWETPGAGAAELAPLCALRAESDWGQGALGDGTAGDLEAWVSSALAEASASSPGARGLAAGATRCVTLVTCSETVPGMPWRTLVLFVDRNA